jgi:hypothetical protein
MFGYAPFLFLPFVVLARLPKQGNEIVMVAVSQH